jgi:hypothetical protein
MRGGSTCVVKSEVYLGPSTTGRGAGGRGSRKGSAVMKFSVNSTENILSSQFAPKPIDGGVRLCVLVSYYQ